MSLPRAIAALTAARGAATWAGAGAGLPLYIGEQPDQPAACITLWVEPDGQAPSIDYAGDESPRSVDIRYVVRHPGDATGKTAPGQAIAQAVLDAMHGTAHTTATDTDTSTLIHVTRIQARTSTPTPIGPDPAGNHEWTVVLSLDYERAP